MLSVRTWVCTLTIIVHLSTASVQSLNPRFDESHPQTPTFPSVDKVAGNGGSRDDVHCYRVSSQAHYGIIDLHSCDLLIDYLRKKARVIALHHDRHDHWYKFAGVDCMIDIFGGSKDASVSEKLLANVAASIIYGSCVMSGRGGVASFGEDEYFLSISSAPAPGPGPVPPPIARAPAVQSSTGVINTTSPDPPITTIQCYRGAGYGHIDLEACDFLLRDMDRGPKLATYRPGQNAHWGDASCNLWLIAGNRPASIWTPRIARQGRNILTTCKWPQDRGGVGFLGTAGFQVAIRSDPSSSRPSGARTADFHVHAPRFVSPPPEAVLVTPSFNRSGPDRVGKPHQGPSMTCHSTRSLPLNDNDCIEMFAHLSRRDGEIPERALSSAQGYRYGLETCRVKVKALTEGVEVGYPEIAKQVNLILRTCSVYRRRAGTGGVRWTERYGVEVYTRRSRTPTDQA